MSTKLDEAHPPANDELLPLIDQIVDKPWYKRTEVTVLAVAEVAAVAASAFGTLSPALAAKLMVASAVAYKVSRGLAKFGTGK